MSKKQTNRDEARKAAWEEYLPKGLLLWDKGEGTYPHESSFRYGFEAGHTAASKRSCVWTEDGRDCYFVSACNGAEHGIQFDYCPSCGGKVVIETSERIGTEQTR